MVKEALERDPRGPLRGLREAVRLQATLPLAAEVVQLCRPWIDWLPSFCRCGRRACGLCIDSGLVGWFA